jgi:hypothetical protein
MILNPRLPTGIPFTCIDEAYETEEPSIVLPGDITPSELGKWVKWVLRASADALSPTLQEIPIFFQGTPGLNELWNEKKRLLIPPIFDLGDPVANKRNFTEIPHRNALIGWYTHLYLYADSITAQCCWKLICRVV